MDRPPDGRAERSLPAEYYALTDDGTAAGVWWRDVGGTSPPGPLSRRRIDVRTDRDNSLVAAVELRRPDGPPEETGLRLDVTEVVDGERRVRSRFLPAGFLLRPAEVRLPAGRSVTLPLAETYAENVWRFPEPLRRRLNESGTAQSGLIAPLRVRQRPGPSKGPGR